MSEVTFQIKFDVSQFPAIKINDIKQVSEIKISKKFLPYEEAKNYINSLKLTKYTEFQKLKKQGKIPNNIPVNPYITYRGLGWNGSVDWIGPTYIGKSDVTHRSVKINRPKQIEKYLSYTEAERLVSSLNLKDGKAYIQYVIENTSIKLPKYPYNIYKDKGWINWPTFLGRQLGYNSIRKKLKVAKYKKFTEAKIFMEKFHLKTWKDWYKFRASKEMPLDMPSTPERFYKNEWTNMKDFLSA